MRGRMSCLWMILKPVLILGGFIAVVSVLVFPWAIPLPGRDTLTGGWVGEVRSSRGPRAWLYMNLDIASGYRIRLLGGYTRLGDDATLCTSRRRIEFYVTGYTTTRSGKSLELLLKPVQPSPPELRLDVKGTWDGHTLELKEADRSLTERLNEPSVAAVESPSSPQWIAASLKRGTKADFDAACAAVAGRR